MCQIPQVRAGDGIRLPIQTERIRRLLLQEGLLPNYPFDVYTKRERWHAAGCKGSRKRTAAEEYDIISCAAFVGRQKETRGLCATVNNKSYINRFSSVHCYKGVLAMM